MRPWARIDSASPLPCSLSNRFRGCLGFGWIWSSWICASSERPEPPIRTSKPRPRPRRVVLSAPVDKLHRHLPVGLGALRAPVVVRHREAVARRLQQPAPERGTTARNTSSPKCLRTSASTSAERRVRASTIVIRTPAIVRRGLSRALIRLIDWISWARPFERVVLGLHRDDHVVGGGKGVHRQRAERGRAVEQHEVEPLGLRERVGEEALSVVALRELDRGAGQLRPRRDEEEVLEAGRRRELAERHAVEEVVRRGAVAPACRARTSRSPAGRGRPRPRARRPRPGRRRG